MCKGHMVRIETFASLDISDTILCIASSIKLIRFGLQEQIYADRSW